MWIERIFQMCFNRTKNQVLEGDSLGFVANGLFSERMRSIGEKDQCRLCTLLRANFCMYLHALINCKSNAMVYHFEERVYVLLPPILNAKNRKPHLPISFDENRKNKKKMQTITGKMSKVRWEEEGENKWYSNGWRTNKIQFIECELQPCSFI